jgi:hypothetical protein
VIVHQVYDESDDDSGPPPGFERHRLMIYLWMLMPAKTMMMKWILKIQIMMIGILKWMIECLAYDLCTVNT